MDTIKVLIPSTVDPSDRAKIGFTLIGFNEEIYRVEVIDENGEESCFEYGGGMDDEKED